ncbi:MAG: GHKL domain-containing protein [bacterium]|nr:GHKL domain-containing protein [bacterium]
MMNIINIILSVAVECLIVIYYSNSDMNYRYSKFRSNLCIVIGYFVYAVICLFGNPVLNAVSNVCMLFVVLRLGFSGQIVYIALNAVIIAMLSIFGEGLASWFIINLYEPINQRLFELENIIIMLTSKLIFYVAMGLLRQLYAKRDKKYKTQEILYFLVLPASTVFLLSGLGKISSEINASNAAVILWAAIFVIISNFIIYMIYNKVLDDVEKINRLKELAYKENFDYTSYKLMKEKYDELKIMIHDFEKYCNHIEGMLGEDQEEALSLIHKFKDKNKEFLLAEYTNNKALNILLTQQQQKFSKENIDFQMYIQDIDLSFIKEFDVVAIFANLLDNAMESCMHSENKKIFLSIKVMNKSFIVIRADNSCDTEPTVYEGKLQTKKLDKDEHGIGMLSIKKSLANYDGSMEWSYDKDNKLFSTILIINRFNPNSD